MQGKAFSEAPLFTFTYRQDQPERNPLLPSLCPTDQEGQYINKRN
jgi:hypothetical protein